MPFPTDGPVPQTAPQAAPQAAPQTHALTILGQAQAFTARRLERAGLVAAFAATGRPAADDTQSLGGTGGPEQLADSLQRLHVAEPLPPHFQRPRDRLDEALAQFCDGVHEILVVAKQRMSPAMRAAGSPASPTSPASPIPPISPVSPSTTTTVVPGMSISALPPNHSTPASAMSTSTSSSSTSTVVGTPLSSNPYRGPSSSPGKGGPIHPKESQLPAEEKDAEFIAQYPTYQLSKFLGRGQAGSVFLGESEAGQPIFAIKVIHLPDAVGIGLPIRRTFLMYQRVLRTLAHPHINPYLGWTVVANEGQVYTAYCSGGTLRKAVHENGGRPGIADVEKVRTWMRQMVSALQYLHDHGIVHRDIKPGNVLLHNGECRIADLGSARLHQSCCSDSHQKRLSGTPAYAAPEAVAGKVAYETAGEDIWGIGCLLYEMVLGEQPWDDHENIFAIYFALGSHYEAHMRGKQSGQGEGDESGDRQGEGKARGTGNPLVERFVAQTASGNAACDVGAAGAAFLEACLQWDPRDRATAHELLAMDFLKE
ncbi:kinase-like domain-containing protein [Entophlyctis helioformis]|nr:kinase-like domain-containing protein [Entophlyctis helioformis]